MTLPPKPGIAGISHVGYAPFFFLSSLLLVFLPCIIFFPMFGAIAI